MSVDPLADKYPGWSPYNYTLNNPINMIDPTGMSAEGIENDYKLDKKGNLSLIKVTDDKTDKIYNSDLSDCIEVDKSFINDSKDVETKNNSVGISGKVSVGDGLSIFQFFANNTEELEWGYSTFSSNGESFGLIHTSYDPEKNVGNPTVAKMIFKSDKNAKMLSDWHSHPNGRGESLPPSGYKYDDGTKSDFMFGDQKYFFSMKRAYKSKVPKSFNLFDPNTNKSYKYTDKSYSKIKY